MHLAQQGGLEHRSRIWLAQATGISPLAGFTMPFASNLIPSNQERQPICSSMSCFPSFVAQFWLDLAYGSFCLPRNNRLSPRCCCRLRPRHIAHWAFEDFKLASNRPLRRSEHQQPRVGLPGKSRDPCPQYSYSQKQTCINKKQQGHLFHQHHWWAAKHSKTSRGKS